jgi:hypothetical protein
MRRMAQQPGDAAALAARLSPRPVRAALALGGGRNARVWRIESDGAPTVLKQYPRQAGNPHDRLAAELAALALMQRAGFESAPRVIATDRDAGALLMTWIDGEAVAEPRAADAEAAAAFLAALHALRQTADIPHTQLAAEACLSGAGIASQIAHRFDRLADVARGETALAAFLSEVFAPAHERLIAAARRAGFFTAVLPQARRTLAPADFGFHNALRRLDGALAFVDFEYFGWDDPVKLTSDLLLHPGTHLAGPVREHLRIACTQIYAATDAQFTTRLEAFHPLFALRWTLILLNEFLPERWQARREAGTQQSWHEAKARQLAKARTMLAPFAGEPAKEAAHAG